MSFISGNFLLSWWLQNKDRAGWVKEVDSDHSNHLEPGGGDTTLHSSLLALADIKEACLPQT